MLKNILIQWQRSLLLNKEKDMEKKTPCECPLAGLCNRHNMNKTPHYKKETWIGQIKFQQQTPQYQPYISLLSLERLKPSHAFL